MMVSLSALVFGKAWRKPHEILAMAYNIQKLHCKIQAEKLNRHRIPVDNAA